MVGRFGTSMAMAFDVPLSNVQAAYGLVEKV